MQKSDYRCACDHCSNAGEFHIFGFVSLCSYCLLFLFEKVTVVWLVRGRCAGHCVFAGLDRLFNGGRHRYLNQVLQSVLSV